MTAHWMAYCAAVGALLALGALALERALAAAGRPTRWAWAAALFLTLALPAAAWMIPDPAETAPTVVRAAAPSADEAPGEPMLLPARTKQAIDLRALDRPLLVLWGASSGAALLVLASLAAVLEMRRRRWRAAAVDGVPVLVSPDTGPAVVGLVRSRIVLPEWACAAEAEVRALMLEHEQEHVRAGDPRLLAGGLIVLAMMPWSPAVWWMLRRLRLAVEVDCDARVLRRRGDVRAYGTLLLEMGRRAGESRLAVAAFSEPTSFLERRIRTMTEPRVRNPLLRAAGFGAVAAALVVAACETPGPVSVAPAAVERVQGEGEMRTMIDARELVARYYPDVLARGAGAGATLTLVFGPDGQVVHHALDRGREPSREITVTDENVRVPLRIRPVLTEIDLNPDDIEQIDLLRFTAGQMGPDPLGIVLITMGEPGSGGSDGDGARIRISGGNPDATPPTTMRGEIALPRQDGRVPLLQRLVEKHRPRVPQGTDQLVWARFTLDAQGKARGVVIEGQPHPAVGEAARKVLEEMVFQPAEDGHAMRLGLDFAQGRGTRMQVQATAERVPATPRETITAELLRAYPTPTADGEYWFMVNDRDQVLDSGTSLAQAAALRALDPDRIAAMQVERLEIGGVPTKVMWIKLKGETSL